MSDDYGVYAPPPRIPGQEPEAAGPPAGRRPRTGLIVGIILLVMLLLCGCSVAAGLIMYQVVDEPSVSTVTVSETPADPADGDRLSEWIAWNPACAEQLPVAPAGDAALIAEATAVLAPGFSVVDSGYSAGFVDALEDYFYGDLYLVRAVHPSSDSVFAALEFTVQSPEMLAEEVPFEVYEGDVVDMLSGDTIQMISRGPFGNTDFPIDSPDGDSLWKTMGQDWPDAVVMRITTETPSQVSVSITKWRQYAIDDYSPRLLAVYELAGGEWALIDWSYEVLDDLPAEPVDDIPVT
ncbi:MAG: hypothetical protein JXE06_10790 [Coriobacteriia bacterium]|nr:hypothetical protein [Coriobacteriia bacterium]MBN2823569.1 hypothetical protein [Coriobacteriia bacterium]